jgi:hypothetical protein
VKQILTGNETGVWDITMLSYWGLIIVEQTTMGFAMEFIGDV